MKIKSSELKVQSYFKNLSAVYCLRSANQRGVTLIELVIVMVLAAIVAVVVANALSTGIKGNLLTDNRKEALDQARVAMERMRREIRNIRDNQSICTATATNIDFYDLSDPAKRIEFNLSSPNIQRREDAGTWYTLATGNSVNLTLRYYNASGIELSPPTVGCPTTTDIKRIRIEVTSTISGESVQLQTEVWPRNL